MIPQSKVGKKENNKKKSPSGVQIDPAGQRYLRCQFPWPMLTITLDGVGIYIVFEDRAPSFFVGPRKIRKPNLRNLASVQII